VYWWFIPEDSPVGAVVGEVRATDKENDTLVFSIKSSEGDTLILHTV